MIKRIKKIILFIIPYLKRTGNLSKTIYPVIGILFASILYIPIPQLLGKATNLLNTGNSLKKFCYYIFLLLIIYTFRYIILIYSKSVLSKIEKIVTTEIKLDMVNKYLNLPLSKIQEDVKGNVMGRFEESSQIAVIFSSGFISMALGFLEFLFSIIMILTMNNYVFVFCLVVIPIYHFILKGTTNAISKATKDLFVNANTVTGKIFECINNIEEIKKVNGKKYIMSGINDANDKFLEVAYIQNKKIHTFTENVQFIYNIVNLGFLIISGILIYMSNLTFAEYLILSGYTLKILSFTQGFSSLDVLIQPASIALDRIKEYLDYKNEDNEDAQEVTKIKNINFKSVSFMYPGSDKRVLKNFNLKLKTGDKLLIQGDIGSGKSSIIKLLQGLYIPKQGVITINDIPINKLNKESLRSRIGVVSQDVLLFHGTILDNICLGNQNITEKDVKEVLYNLGLEGFPNQFENGLNTVVSKNAQGVSGGQAKIIALLRALSTFKDIIILDETTSNLDDFAEEKIINSFMKKNISDILIVITHDQSWNLIENKIVLNNGQISNFRKIETVES